MKANIKQLVNERLVNLIKAGYSAQTIETMSVPNDLMNFGELIDFVSLVSEGEIEQFIHDQEDKDTAETINDNRYAGAPY